MFFKKKKVAVCPASILFGILNDNLQQGLCTDIYFLADGRKHRFGAYGEQGNTYQNVVFYLDGYECGSKEEFCEHACIDGIPLLEYGGLLTVTECDGCYPDSTPRLVPYLQ